MSSQDDKENENKKELEKFCRSIFENLEEFISDMMSDTGDAENEDYKAVKHRHRSFTIGGVADLRDRKWSNFEENTESRPKINSCLRSYSGSRQAETKREKVDVYTSFFNIVPRNIVEDIRDIGASTDSGINASSNDVSSVEDNEDHVLIPIDIQESTERKIDVSQNDYMVIKEYETFQTGLSNCMETIRKYSKVIQTDMAASDFTISDVETSGTSESDQSCEESDEFFSCTSDVSEEEIYTDEERTETAHSTLQERDKRSGIGYSEYEDNYTSLDEKDVEDLIQERKLPTQMVLNKICRVRGRKSKILMAMCKAICTHIKTVSDDILHVWAAYKLQNPEDIVFVVHLKLSYAEVTNKQSLYLQDINFDFTIRYRDDFSPEAAQIIKHVQSINIDDSANQMMKSCILNHSEHLMKQHRYLTMISASSYRSKGSGLSCKSFPEICMVLYVYTKDYIPIEEEPFKKVYGGIAVDVREGAFIPFGRTAREKLDPIKMGCEIGSDKGTGTLGCFIDHPKFGLCGLTCAHVLLSADELEELRTEHDGSITWPLGNMHKDVFQPNDNESLIGHTVQLIYKNGNEFGDGMDVALFKITNRKPNTAKFPEKTILSGTYNVADIRYDNWRICNLDMLKAKQVVKFGSKTELRKGTLASDYVSVKILDIADIENGSSSIQLFKQIEFTPSVTDIPFAAKGDSGSLVFAVDDDIQNTCTCIGIIEGGSTYGTVIVSPIVPILKELNVPCFKSFEAESNFSNIHDKIKDIHDEMKGIKDGNTEIHRDLKLIKDILLNPQGRSNTIDSRLSHDTENKNQSAEGTEVVRTMKNVSNGP